MEQKSDLPVDCGASEIFKQTKSETDHFKVYKSGLVTLLKCERTVWLAGCTKLQLKIIDSEVDHG